MCLLTYRNRRDWDPAFELITRAGLVDELDHLLESALDDLLDTARLSTLERWCEFAYGAQRQTPRASLARAEVLLRHGRHLEAVSYAESAATDLAIEFRAVAVAGRAAHLASREEAALELFRRAEKAASTEAERRDARWGQLTCLIDLELPEAIPTLDELSSDVTFGDPREVARMATHRLYLQLRTAALELEDADIAHQLIDAVDDPIVETSFLSGYGIALALAARYQEAKLAAAELRARAERYRLDFATPYAHCATAMALAGMRQWGDAERAATRALTLAEARVDVHAELLSRSTLMRLYAQQGRTSSALGVAEGRLPGAPSVCIAEASCSRALALASAGRIDDARELVAEVRGTTHAIEPAVLIPAVEAICAVRGAAPEALSQVTDLRKIAFETGAVDLLVTAYRACPELLPVLLRAGDSRDFRELVERVGDSDLAAAVGHPLATNDDRRMLLSPREREVFDLLRSGFTNRQIAKLLFIELSTVKAHAHHIYDKLGVRSRHALMVQAALERSAYATPRTEISANETTSASCDDPSR
jgi:DNA-binding CsgD family transcriptional regulator